MFNKRGTVFFRLPALRCGFFKPADEEHDNAHHVQQCRDQVEHAAADCIKNESAHEIAEDRRDLDKEIDSLLLCFGQISASRLIGKPQDDKLYEHKRSEQ